MAAGGRADEWRKRDKDPRQAGYLERGYEMNITKSKQNANGTTTLTVTIKPGETLIALQEDAFYELGEPMDDVINGHILIDAKRVTWCPLEQKWIR